MLGQSAANRDNGLKKVVVNYKKKHFRYTRKFDLDFKYHNAIEQFLELNGYTDFFEVFEDGKYLIGEYSRGVFFVNVLGLKGYSKIAKRINVGVSTFSTWVRRAARVEFNRYNRIECAVFLHIAIPPKILRP